MVSSPEAESLAPAGVLRPVDSVRFRSARQASEDTAVDGVVVL